jgi:hypothetical protein
MGIAMRDREAEQIIRTVFGEEFPDARVDRVIARAEEDSDGDRVIRVYIVLDDDRQSLDRKALVGFVRHLKSRLTDEAFPVLSFVAQSEAAKLKLEPV